MAYKDGLQFNILLPALSEFVHHLQEPRSVSQWRSSLLHIIGSKFKIGREDLDSHTGVGRLNVRQVLLILLSHQRTRSL